MEFKFEEDTRNEERKKLTKSGANANLFTTNHIQSMLKSSSD